MWNAACDAARVEVAMTGSAHQRGAGIARKALLARKKKIARLAASLQTGENKLESAGRADALDRASDAEAHDVLQRLQAVEARELAEIDAALVRVRKGTYGK